MRSALLLALCAGVGAQTYAAVEANAACTNGVGCKGYYRAFVATTLPANSDFGPPSNVTGLALAAIGVQAQSDGTVTNGRVDVAGLKFRTPADTSDKPDLSFYFGYLGVSGVWDNKTQTGALTGALCEIYSSFNSIQIYYDRDSTPGFQFDLTGNDVFDCTKTWDCVDPAGAIAITNLTWDNITRVVDTCVSKIPNGNYDANCKIITLSTIGRMNGTAVVTIDIRTASQPLTIDGVLHNPDKAKWDVRVNYPWAVMTGIATPASAKVALVNVHAGKAATAAGVVTVNSGTVSKSLTFTGTGKSAYFGYSTAVTVDGAASTVVTQTITAEAISNWNGNLLTKTADLMGKLKVAVIVYAVFGGWRVQLTIHSFTPSAPNNIFWDPENGVLSTSGAMATVPAMLLALVLALLF
jgi:hypothetical protein